MVSRRSFVTLLVGGGSLGAAYKYPNRTKSLGADALELLYGDPDKVPVHRVDLQDLYFDGTTLVLVFEPDFPHDGWGISHEYKDVAKDPLLIAEPPSFEGPIELPFDMLLNHYGESEYPSRTFEFTVLEGIFSSASYLNRRHRPTGTILDTGATVQFDVPKTVLPENRVYNR